MKTLIFNNLEEMKPYYNVNTNTYEFIENGKRLNIEFTFNLNIDSHINARDINARDINALDIKAWNIDARGINAWNINYYAICFAYESIVCEEIKGRRENCKHFCLDGEIIIKPKKSEKDLAIEKAE